MAFELRVEFTGLCLYLVHATPPAGREAGDPLDASMVTVVLPDCRKGKVATRHEDGDKGRPHAGYLRFDLANFVDGFPSGPTDKTPQYEVVHLFSGEMLEFGLPLEETMHVHTGVPEFESFAPTLEPRPDLPAGGYSIMRTTLTGGSLVGEPIPRDVWEFSNLFNTTGKPAYVGEFAETLIWSRKITGDTEDMTLTLTPFRPGVPLTIPLKAVGPPGNKKISLKIANLCCDNPLEWDELDSRQNPDDDIDFKWLYRLMRSSDGKTYPQMLGEKGKFPIPEQSGEERGGEGCIGASRIV
jgi:hypothetical protein